jgi:hypothetical protein
VARSSKGTKTRTLRASKGHYAGIDATGPIPSGFRLAATHFVTWLRPMNHIDPANFRVDCLASRETEYGQHGRKGL